MKYTLHKLQVLQAIIKEGSMNKASKKLNMSQSTISRSLMSLEHALAMKIFYRHKNQIELTKEGKALLLQSELLLNRVAQFEENLALIKQGLKELRIGAPSGLATGFMPQVIKRYKHYQDDAGVRLEIRSSQALCNDVNNGDLDVALVAVKTDLHNAVMKKTVINAPLVCILPKVHPLSTCRTLSNEQISSHSVILPNRLELAGSWVDNINLKRIKRAQISANFASIPGMVAQGLGLTVLNVLTAYDMSDISKVKILPFEPKTDLFFHLIYRKDWAENQNINYLFTSIQKTITAYKRSMHPRQSRLLQYIKTNELD